MQVHRYGHGRSNRAPELSFSGDVVISGYFQRSAPSRLAGAAASFPPGSRTPWKRTPLGQTLIVTSGVGWAQCEGCKTIKKAELLRNKYMEAKMSDGNTGRAA